MSSTPLVAPRAVLADRIPQVVARDVLLVTAGALLTAAAAQVFVPLPFTPVPISGQTFAVLLVAAALGPARGVAAGIVQHLDDDRWFHQTRVFAETCLEFALQLRQRLPGDEGFRPSFLGHILVEILIDATLMARDPSLGDRYYAALAAAAPQRVQQTVNQIARVSTDQLDPWIWRFLEVRFLYDYLDDDKLLFRLEQVMKRVGLPPLGNQLSDWFPHARAIVAERCDSLLTDPNASPPTNPSPLRDPT
jgi:hypothetical protein